MFDALIPLAPGPNLVSDMNGGTWIRVAALLGLLGVALGAFGAHALKDRLESLGTLTTYHTGVQYHFYHVLALLAVGLMWGPLRGRASLSVAAWAFLVGVILFSGSLYVLAFTGIKKLGIITPFGGLAFLVGWAVLAIGASTSEEGAVTERPGALHTISDTRVADDPDSSGLKRK